MNEQTPPVEDEHLTFTNDLLGEGFSVEQYEPRYGWTVPAVRVEGSRELQKVIRATQVVLDWDTLGMGWIVYPMRQAREAR